MDQTRYTLIGIFVSAALAIMAGFLSQWYSAGARPTGNGAQPTETMLAQTVAAVTQVAETLPTPIATEFVGNSSKLGPEPTNTFYDNVLERGRGWQLIEFDSFDDNENGWGTGIASNRADGERRIRDGQLVWDLIGLQSLTWADGVIGAPFDDFLVSVDVERDSAEIGSIGLVFRQQDYDNYFQFQLCEGPQQYEVWQKLNDEWTSITSCTDTNVPTLDGPNNLSVVALDSSYFLFVNDQLVETFDNSDFSGGIVGVTIDLDADQTNRFIFDNFELRAPLDQ